MNKSWFTVIYKVFVFCRQQKMFFIPVQKPQNYWCFSLKWKRRKLLKLIIHEKPTMITKTSNTINLVFFKECFIMCIIMNTVCFSFKLLCMTNALGTLKGLYKNMIYGSKRPLKWTSSHYCKSLLPLYRYTCEVFP